MAKFRNVDKRRPWETEEQKRERKFWEDGLVLKHRVELALAKHGVGARVSVSVERSFSGKPFSREGMLMMAGAVVDDADIRQLGGAPAPEGAFTDGELLLRYLARLAFRLRRWFRDFWSAARFTHPAGWLLEGQNRTRL